MSAPRLLVVTNFASHYRAPLFERLHERLGAEFIFFSRGGEGYWQPHLGTTRGAFPAKTVADGPHLGKLRFNTQLWQELNARPYDVVVKCMNGRLELPMAYAAARRKGAAFVLWTGMWMHPRSAFHTVSRPFTRWIYRHSDAIVPYGSHVSRFVVGEGANARKVFEADNATNNQAFGRQVSGDEIGRVRSECGVGSGGMVLAVSRLVPEKGLDVLLDAVGALPGARPTIVVVGTGPLENHLKHRAQELGVSIVIVSGLQPAEMPPYYAAADVFVMPSVTTRTFKEPWGLACNEAMLQGVPVIATDAVGAAAGGLVENGVTGLVVPERDSMALGTALATVLRDRALARRLGDEGKARVAKVDYDNMVRAFEDAIAYAVEHRAGRR
jgi:glycosyltransferase involved in cell wall biosynthesis